MGNFAVVVVKPEGYIHAEAFRPVQQMLVQALGELGHDAIAADSYHEPPRRNIVLGVNLIERYGILPPAGSILYNLEQCDKSSTWMNAGTVSLFKADSLVIRGERITADSMYELWDYSAQNVEWWKRSVAIHDVKLVEIGYVKPTQPTKYLAEEERDIDVLFYGSVNERRARVLDDLHARGLKVEALFGVYGDELERYIERAKVVLNMHFYDAQIFEIVRVSHLLRHGRFVVSEWGGLCRAFEGIELAPYENLADVCAEMVKRPEHRARAAQIGKHIFQEMPFSENLRSVVGA